MAYFEYSIGYPDVGAIRFPARIVASEKALQLVNTFNWNQELKKEIIYDSPRFDFVNLDDKHRFILSGIGEGELTEFMIIFLIPNDPMAIEFFAEDNYYDSPSYAAPFTIEEGKKKFKSFLRQDYQSVIKNISKQELAISSGTNQPALDDQQQVTTYQDTASVSSSDKEEENSIFLEIFVRVMGFAFCLFFLVVAIFTLCTYPPSPIWVSLFFAGLSLFFGVGAVRYEKKSRNKKRKLFMRIKSKRNYCLKIRRQSWKAL